MTDQQGVPGRIREGLGTTDGFHAAIAAVDVAGWDSEVGQELLRYLRFEVVAPAVEARRLRGAAREDASQASSCLRQSRRSSPGGTGIAGGEHLPAQKSPAVPPRQGSACPQRDHTRCSGR